MKFTKPEGHHPFDEPNDVQAQRVCNVMPEAGMPIKELCRNGGFSDATFYIYGLPVRRNH